MTTIEARPPVQAGEQAPDFTLPAVDRDVAVSLADYRGQTPVLLALMRGLYCPFCRREIARLGLTRKKLQPLGVEALGIVATPPERARLYYRFRPMGLPLAADPDLTTHRTYGVPNRPMASEVMQMIATRYVGLARELKIPAVDMEEIDAALGREDGFEPVDTDQQDMQRHGAQLAGEFLIDRGGIVRWAYIERFEEGFPSEEEILAAARALPR